MKALEKLLYQRRWNISMEVDGTWCSFENKQRWFLGVSIFQLSFRFQMQILFYNTCSNSPDSVSIGHLLYCFKGSWHYNFLNETNQAKMATKCSERPVNRSPTHTTTAKTHATNGLRNWRNSQHIMNQQLQGLHNLHNNPHFTLPLRKMTSFGQTPTESQKWVAPAILAQASETLPMVLPAARQWWNHSSRRNNCQRAQNFSMSMISWKHTSLKRCHFFLTISSQGSHPPRRKWAHTSCK